MLTCRDQPVPPEIKTDTDLTDWMLDVIDAGSDCRSKLRRVGELIQSQPK